MFRRNGLGMELGFGLQLQAEQPRGLTRVGSRSARGEPRRLRGCARGACTRGSASFARPQRFPVAVLLASSLGHPGVSAGDSTSSTRGSSAAFPSTDRRVWQLRGGQSPCPCSRGGTEACLRSSYRAEASAVSAALPTFPTPDQRHGDTRGNLKATESKRDSSGRIHRATCADERLPRPRSPCNAPCRGSSRSGGACCAGCGAGAPVKWGGG